MAKTVLITGANRGIGKALAYHLASRGYNLALTSRREQELAEIQNDVGSKYPAIKVQTRVLDVTEYIKVHHVINELSSAMDGLDIVIANAGSYEDGPVGKGNFEKYRQTIETNLLGAVATADAAIALFRQRGKGHIVALSSVLAFRGLPGSASYSAAKGGVSIFLETARAELARKNIDVTVLFPGYIDTDLNRALKSRPFLISAEKGAAVITRLIEKRVKRSAVPVFPWNFIGRILKILPDFIIAKM